MSEKKSGVQKQTLSNNEKPPKEIIRGDIQVTREKVGGSQITYMTRVTKPVKK